jgi:DNA-binding response OmpR family regulator
MATVLVVDEERDWRTLLKRLLERIGHQVLMCSDPGEALNWAESKILDLAIITLRVVDERSFDLPIRLKTSQRDLRIMIVADYVSDEVAQRFMADGSLVRPADIETIEREVRELLQGATSQRTCPELEQTPAAR